MKRALLVTSLVCSALVVGCGDDKPAATISNTTPSGNEEDTAETGSADGTSAGETGGGPTNPDDTDPDPTTGVMSGPASSEGGESGTSMPFIMEKDIPVEGMCNPFEQDCPEGQKCQPYAEGGGSSWNANKCFPDEGDGKEGDACFAAMGGVAGYDDCDVGFFCWGVDAMMNGYCVQLCTGSMDAGECANVDKACAVYNEGTLPICLDGCDPLAPECVDTDACIPNPSGDGYLCVPDASGDEGQENDPCEFANACDPGLYCAPTTAGNMCDPNATGCCQLICDINEPGVCTGDGQSCILLKPEEMNPDNQDVGYCSLPI